MYSHLELLLTDARLSAGRAVTRIIELLVFAWLLPAIGLFAFAEDPVGLQAGFPWVMAGPLVFAARYGSLWGLGCAVLSGLFISLPVAAYTVLGHQPVSLLLGTLLMALVIGDAGASWRKRSRQSEAENQYLHHRLKEFSADYHVLKVSHGLLEEHMAGQRLSLRVALQRLKPVLSSGQEGLQAGSELMAVFSQFCSIQVAGLYAMSGVGLVDKRPVATHGDMLDLPLFDPLLRTAIQEKELVSIKLESLADDHHEKSLLAVVPLVDTDGHLHGVLAIKDMHFMAFQQQNLNILALLGNYVGIMLTRSRGMAGSRSDWFQAELDTAMRFARSHASESALLVMKFHTDPHATEVAEFVSQSMRGLDASLQLESGDGAVILCLLLPLMGTSQGKAFLQRIEQAVADYSGRALASLLAEQGIMLIGPEDTRQGCIDFLNRYAGGTLLNSTDTQGTAVEDKRENWTGAA